MMELIPNWTTSKVEIITSDLLDELLWTTIVINFPISPDAPTITEYVTAIIATLALASALWAGASAYKSSRAAQAQLLRLIKNDEQSIADKVTMWIHEGDDGPEVWYLSPDGPIFDVNVHLQVDEQVELVRIPILGPAKEVKRIINIQEELDRLLDSAASAAAKDSGMSEAVFIATHYLTKFRALTGTRGIAFAFIDIAGRHWYRSQNGKLVSIEDVNQIRIVQKPAMGHRIL